MSIQHFQKELSLNYESFWIALKFVASIWRFQFRSIVVDGNLGSKLKLLFQFATSILSWPFQVNERICWEAYLSLELDRDQVSYWRNVPTHARIDSYKKCFFLNSVLQRQIKLYLVVQDLPIWWASPTTSWRKGNLPFWWISLWVRFIHLIHLGSTLWGYLCYGWDCRRVGCFQREELGCQGTIIFLRRIAEVIPLILSIVGGWNLWVGMNLALFCHIFVLLLLFSQIGSHCLMFIQQGWVFLHWFSRSEWRCEPN